MLAACALPVYADGVPAAAATPNTKAAAFTAQPAAAPVVATATASAAKAKNDKAEHTDVSISAALAIVVALALVALSKRRAPPMADERAPLLRALARKRFPHS